MADLANAHLIYALLREEQIAAEFAAALERRFLDEKFFYWLPPSVAAWCDLCNAPAYRNANRALTLLRREAPRLAQIARNASAICGLGCGEGSKDEIILQAFAAQKRAAGYVAADFSQALIERALDRCAAHAQKQIGVKLDEFLEEHLAQLAKLAQQTADGSIIYSVLGNTFGAFDPHDFPRRLWKIMRPADWALVDGEIFAGEETLAGYDHPDNRRFAFAPLAALGAEEGRDGALRFELRAGSDGVHEVVKYFEPGRDLEIRYGGGEIHLPRGQRLRMSSSLKYDEPRFLELAQAKVFSLAHFAKSDDGRFMLALLKPKSKS